LSRLSIMLLATYPADLTYHRWLTPIVIAHQIGDKVTHRPITKSQTRQVPAAYLVPALVAAWAPALLSLRLSYNCQELAAAQAWIGMFSAEHPSSKKVVSFRGQRSPE
jgi:hypothetical protein